MSEYTHTHIQTLIFISFFTSLSRALCFAIATVAKMTAKKKEKKRKEKNRQTELAAAATDGYIKVIHH